MKKKPILWRRFWRQNKGIIRMMKMTCLLMMTTLVAAAYTSSGQTGLVDLNAKDQTLIEIFREIEEKTGYGFFVKSELIDFTDRYSIESKGESVEKVLQTLLGDEFTWQVVNNNITVMRKESPSQTGSLQVQNAVSGRVFDESGNSLPGVSVVIKGTITGTVTDVNGYYTLANLQPGTILVFSFVGMQTQEVLVGNQTTIDVVLQAETLGLDEVVVIGYGTVRKRDLTGSVGAVRAKDMDKMALNDAAKALTGRLAGVLVTENTQPGGASSILIRGKRSITAGNDPLLVVDGTPVAGGLNDFPVADIRSIEVLKDASATAIYGSRAANGVILITTNRGDFNQKGQINYSGYYGIQSAANKQSFMSPAQFMERNRWYNYMVGKYVDPTNPTLEQDRMMIPYSNTAVRENLWDPSTRQLIEAAYAGGTYDPSRLGGTNWLDLQTQTGFVTDHQLSFSGGSENVSAYISGNYYQNEGIDIYSKYNRFNVRANIDYKVVDWWKISVTSSNSIIDDPSFGNIRGNTIPVANAYNADGLLNYLPGNDGLLLEFWNPLANPQGAVIKEDRSFRYFQSIANEIRFGQTGLSYKMLASFDGSSGNYGEYHGQWSSSQQGNLSSLGIGQNLANNMRSSSQNYLLENILYYQKTFGEDHSFGAVAGWTIQEFNSEFVRARGQNNPLDYQLWHNMAGYVDNPRNESFKSSYALQSYLARVNYAYKDRYLLTASFRTDGSSVFSVGNKYDYFPSFAVAWKIDEESFMSGMSKLDQLKLRLGYGVIGNSAILPGSTLSTIRMVASNFGHPGSMVPNYGFIPATLGNVLRWEKTGQWNLGLDFSVWNGRLDGSIDGYLSKTTDLLMPRKLPIAIAGFAETIQNIGQTSNRGVELSLSSVIIQNRDFRWVTDFTASYNNERIDAIYKEGDDIDNQWFIGHPIDVYYDYKFIRIMDSQINPGDQAIIDAKNAAEGSAKYRDGDVLVRDNNGDGKITADEDRFILGKVRPDFISGLNNTFVYKNFELSFMLYALTGHMGMQSWSGGAERDNGPVIDYWTPQNRSAAFPRLGTSQPIENRTSGYFNSSFVRLRNASISYNVPANISQKLWLERLNVYMALHNPNVVLVSSRFMGLDPQYNTNIGGVSQPMIFMFGIKAGV